MCDNTILSDGTYRGMKPSKQVTVNDGFITVDTIIPYKYFAKIQNYKFNLKKREKKNKLIKEGKKGKSQHQQIMYLNHLRSKGASPWSFLCNIYSYCSSIQTLQ